MQKFLTRIAFLAVAAVAIYWGRVSIVERLADKQVKRVEQIQVRQQATMEQRLKEQQEAQEQRRLDEPVKVLVKAREVRTCLKDLNTDTISNDVVECTKDHYVTVKRRDVLQE